MNFGDSEDYQAFPSNEAATQLPEQEKEAQAWSELHQLMGQFLDKIGPIRLSSTEHDLHEDYWGQVRPEEEISFVKMGLDDFIKDGIVLTNRNPDIFG